MFSLMKAARIAPLQLRWRCDEKRAPVWKRCSDFTTL